MKKKILAMTAVLSISTCSVLAASSDMDREAALAARGQNVEAGAQQAAPAVQSSYKLRPGDQLSIVVTQQAALENMASAAQTPFTVRPDGHVSFPMVGDVNVAGMTVEEFTEVLQGGLSRYIVDPDVSVNIVKLGGVRVYVFGEISKPGVYELTKSHRVIDAIGAASGFTWDTAKKKLFLIHQDATDKPILVNLNRMLETGDMADNYEMREGDVLYLTRNGRISFARDIAPIFNSYYLLKEATKN